MSPVAALRVEPGLARGLVRHRRHRPHAHVLRHPQRMALLDLDALPDTLQRPRPWQWLARAGLRFERGDYMRPVERPLAELVRERVAEATGRRPDGPVILLAHLRQWGWCFNPVVFYFCHAGGRLVAIVAEITNTPWGERHAYVLDADTAEPRPHGLRFAFRKAFHVSPFLPMDMDYRWTFTLRPGTIGILMQLYRVGELVFDASYGLDIEPGVPIERSALAWRRPLQCQRVSWAIYWHALRLKLKKTAFHPHPNKS
jgi:DUF1365 family protein